MATDQLSQEIQDLKKRSENAQLPQQLYQEIEKQLNRLTRIARTEGYSVEYDRIAHYIDWVTNLPWNDRSPETLALTKAREVLDKSHYGLKEVKERIVEYLAVLQLKTQQHKEGEAIHAPILCLVGLVGTGKTTVAYSIAEAIGRPLSRIPFGGMGSARDLRGQSRLHAEAEPGYIIKALRRAKVRNPVMLLDEIDRVSEEARSDIMGVLIELLDPEQNFAFVDHYIDYPFDLSEVLFITTANNTTNIATAVMDRLEPIAMPSYTDEEKTRIGRDYLLLDAMAEAGLTKENLQIDDTVWPKIVRPLGFDAGIRTLQRTIQGITRKVAKKVVEGETQSIHITAENVSEYLPE
ncbi:AAA family ATPase [Patescibacteria group bacterium]|nr:AAA family ATPase [Patescibacteria group bacterium]